MHDGHRPRIVFADLIILVAAIAFGMAVLRPTIESSGGGYLRHVPGPHSHWEGRLGYWPPFYFFFVMVVGAPQILAVCCCITGLSLRRRQSSGLRCAHRPGFVLCLVAVAAAALAILTHGPALSFQRFESRLDLWRLIVFGILPTAGYMVLGSWMALALGGRALPAPSWLDRIGFALGASLVFLLALDTGRMILESARVM